MKRGFPKKLGIFLGLAIGVIGLLILFLHDNPLAVPKAELIKKIVAGVVIIVAMVCYVVLYDKITTLPVELWHNRKLIWKLAKSDFKTRYAGSYLGVVWATVQPIVTVVLYYFVFQVVFKSRASLNGTDVPYVLWLTAGLVPWFYFSEALGAGTSALLEYSYLVKKVVFKISILPIIKIVSATFTHLFFMGVMLILYFAYGNAPSIYMIQILYFSFCMFLFVLAISYATCAIVIFFRDLSQIIGIVLQVGMWATPILWDIQLIAKAPQWIRILIKMNPVFYIVDGYRNALYGKMWFWQNFYSTMYFWIVVALLFGVGTLVFKRLKPHFADTL
ncbi:MAG: ABC transporter permease [Lachnospiraceae bacterium]|nr:ABC transporter permease [Lachnospiraceae bacterium]